MEYDRIIDCTGVYCPMPIIRTKKEIEDMTPGQIIRVESDDAGAKSDFPAWCAETGNILLSSEETDNTFIFYIKKGGAST